ncbi:pre-B-cell leukemia transcription factor-interacting protein 1 isoform X2 [Gopherus flavomarginatus]|uniref:pre-B-cell leukemia transcription factor-interacting protein 1 isoform X2 n=1 Tax=Gopherus flavomarginatus TaxID=286002 RepID=UPI0021CC0458|nr:pre-B-cell leukemia transcription factor-interacting protein 1 isoform X2 [Gopherus flavomarginatus]
MAENSDSRDSDNSWVIAGSEGLPVETVGPELGTVIQTPVDEEPAGHTFPEGHSTEDVHTGTKSEGSQLNMSPGPEEAEFNDSEECPQETLSLAASPRPGAQGHEAPEIQAQDGPGSEDPELGSDTNTLGSAPSGRAGEPPEEVSSSEDDAEGLQQWQLRDSHRAPCGPAERRGAEAAGDGESGLSVNSCLLGVLALLGVGLLTFSGPTESMDPGDIPDGEQQPLAAGVKDWLQQPPLHSAGDPQSLHSMSLLLDKLAKENQDIRLMQAELQAQKDELQALLQKSEGEKASAGSQQQSLAGENARLHQALQQAAEAHRSAQAELQVLREQLQGLEQEGAAETPRAAPELPNEDQLLHQELAKQRGLLGSVQRELEGALQRAQGSGGMEQLRVELAGLEQQLAQELQRVESWEQNYSKGRSGEGRGATEPSRPRRQEPSKTDKKEGGWHKRSEAREERRRQHGDLGDREQDGAKRPKRREQPEPHRRQGPRDTKPAKDQNGQRRAGGGKAALHGTHEHNVFWEPPRLQRYRAPQGCTGVAGCARQEGLELFGAELAPVQKGQFLQLLQGYMAGLGWGQHFAGVAARLDGAFASDGTFAHDRLCFRHFVEDVEELLEELAEQEQGHEEAADDFEEYVLQHYGGDGFTKKESERRRAKQRSKQLHGHGPLRDRDGHRGKESSPPDKG